MKEKKILIIEDDEAIQSALHDACKDAGFSCAIANDGEAGLALSLEEKPDLIILDLLMPKMDGMTLLKKLRADAWGADVRVLILTNLSADEPARIKDAVETYPEYYLVKSDWAIGDIVKKVEEMLRA